MSDSPNITDHSQRRKRLLQKIGGATLLVSNLVNIRYLTGFTGSNAFLLLNESQTIFLTDGRYVEQVASECPDLETRIRPVDSTMLELIAEALKDSGSEQCLIEADSMTRRLWRDLSKEIGNRIQLQDSSHIVEQLRAIKDEYELKSIRRSVEINEDSILATLNSYEPSWSELEFSWHLEREIRSRGGTGFSFDAIVAAGPSSAFPHYRPSAALIAEQKILLVDWGTAFEGYASDLTRVASFEDAPKKIQEIHKIVSDAKQAAIEAVRDGVELREVDSAARELIAGAGYGDYFNHGLGHGFGLEIHETPFLSPVHSGNLSAGMVITIEPGIYLPGIGGVRLEDDVLVTEDGCERLNQMPDDFLIL